MPGYLVVWQEFCSETGCRLVMVGWLGISTTLRSKTWPHQGSWDVNIEIRALSAWGEGHDGFNLRGHVGCEGACNPLHTGFEKQLLKVGHVVSGTGSVTGTIDTPGEWRIGHGTMTVDIEAVRPALPGSHTVRVDPDVRCDTIVSSQTGCVFPQAGIVYDLSSDLYPEVAYHVRSAQNSGLVGVDVPLHRTTDEGIAQQNRYVACNPSIPRPIGLSCDEYPFASTYEGAARWGSGHGRTFPDCRRSDLPTLPTGPEGWSACMVDYAENSGQGADLNTFYWRNRVLDGDDFYVEVF